MKAVLSAPAKNKSRRLGGFFVFEWGKGSNSAREFDYKRKAHGCVPVSDSE